MLYISIMKYAFIIVTFISIIVGPAGYGQEASQVTNGIDEYWNPSERQLFELFTRKYWSARKVNHNYELNHRTLLIRLEDQTKKIASLRKYGKAERADLLEQNVRDQNAFTIDYMRDNYKGSNYFFYYGKDAESIFLNSDYSFLYTDLETKAEKVVIDKMAYVLMYKSYPRGKQGKAYGLYIWDKHNVHKVRKHLYDSFLNFDKTSKYSLMLFCDKVMKAKYN